MVEVYEPGKKMSPEQLQKYLADQRRADKARGREGNKANDQDQKIIRITATQKS